MVMVSTLDMEHRGKTADMNRHRLRATDGIISAAGKMENEGGKFVKNLMTRNKNP